MATSITKGLPGQASATAPPRGGVTDGTATVDAGPAVTPQPGDEILIGSRLRVHLYERRTWVFADDVMWVRTWCGKYGQIVGQPHPGDRRCRACILAATSAA